MGVSTGAIRAGRAYVELGLDQSKFVKGLRAAEKELKALGQSIMKIGAGLTAAGGAITGVFTAAAKSFVSAGDAINDMASRTGVSAGALQALGFAAKMSGSDVESLETGLRLMQRTITDAAGGSKSAAKSLTDVGLSVQALAGMAPEDQFTAVAEAISQIGDPTRRAAMAMDLFGRSGTSLIPMIEEGSAGLSAMAQRFAQLGPPLTAADVTLAALADDVWNELLTAFKAITNQVGASVTPALVELAQVATELIADGARWASRNRELLLTIAKVGAAVAVAGAAIVALGASVSVAGIILGGVATAITFVGSAIAALLSPIGLAIAGVTAAGAAFVAFTDTGRAMADTVTTALGEVVAKAKEIGGAVLNALTSGDIQSAQEVLVVSFRLVLKHIEAAFTNVWGSIKVGVLNVLDQIATATANFANTVIQKLLAIEKTAVNLAASLADGASRLAGRAISGVGGMVGSKTMQGVGAGVGAAGTAMSVAVAQVNEGMANAAGAIANAVDHAVTVTASSAQNARTKELIDSLDADQEALDKLREELRAALSAANHAAPLLATQALGPENAWHMGNPIAGGTDAAAQLVRQATSGTFSAANVAGLGPNTTLEKIRNAAEETARHMRRLLDNPPGRVPLNFA